MLEATVQHRSKSPGVDDGVFLLAFSRTEEEKAALREVASNLDIIERETEYTVYFRDPENNQFAVSTYPIVPA